MDDVPAGLLADAHVSPPSPHRALWYAAECGQRPPAKFMRLDPLESDSYWDNDDKTQPTMQIGAQDKQWLTWSGLEHAQTLHSHKSKVLVQDCRMRGQGFFLPPAVCQRHKSDAIPSEP